MDNLTVCIPTSVMRTAPDTCLVKYVIDKLYDKAPIKGCPIVISYDYNPKRFGNVADKYLENLISMGKVRGIKIVYSSPLPGWNTGQRQSFLNMTNVDTPYLLHFEHDWVFNEYVPIDKIVEAMKCYSINYVAFNKRKNVKRGCDYILKPSNITNPYLLMSSRYSNNPHISTRDFWQVRIRNILEQCKNVLNSHVTERPVYNSYVRDIKREGFDCAHAKWRTYVYGKMNQGPIISHIDGHKWTPAKVR